MPRYPAAIVVAFLALSASLHAQDKAYPADSAHGRIQFAFSEVARDTTRPPVIYLSYQTERAYGCLLPLLTTVERSERKYVLGDWRIGGDELCPTQVYPAAGRMSLALDTGRTTLVIRHLGSEDLYLVTVSSERIRVNPLDTPRVSRTPASDLIRYPPHSFALSCGGYAQRWHCDGLFRSVNAVAGIEGLRMPHDGRNPFNRTALQDGLHDDVVVQDETVRVFRFHSSQAFDQARAASRRYRDEVTPGQRGLLLNGRSWTGISW